MKGFSKWKRRVWNWIVYFFLLNHPVQAHSQLNYIIPGWVMVSHWWRFLSSWISYWKIVVLRSGINYAYASNKFEWSLAELTITLNSNVATTITYTIALFISIWPFLEANFNSARIYIIPCEWNESNKNWLRIFWRKRETRKTIRFEFVSIVLSNWKLNYGELLITFLQSWITNFQTVFSTISCCSENSMENTLRIQSREVAETTNDVWRLNGLLRIPLTPDIIELK